MKVSNLKYESFSDFLENFKVTKGMQMFYNLEDDATFIPKVDVTFIHFTKTGEIGISVFHRKLTSKNRTILGSNYREVSDSQIKKRKLPVKYYVGKIKPKFKKGDRFKSLQTSEKFTIKIVRNATKKETDSGRYSYFLQGNEIYHVNEVDLLTYIKEGLIKKT